MQLSIQFVNWLIRIFGVLFFEEKMKRPHYRNFIAFAGFMYYIKLILDDAIKKQQPDFFEVR